MEKELMHAETMKADLGYLKSGPESRHNLRMTTNFETLLELAIKVVSTSYDEREEAIEKLEEFLL